MSRFMTEGRLCQVHLLDDRKLELLVQPKLLSRELLDLVSSHFNLKEKEYFGLTFVDDSGQCKYLQLDRRVLEHDFSKKATGPIALNFLVRFYIESITLLKDNTTVELFFLNAKAAVYNVSYLLFHSAFDETTRTELKKLPTLPNKVLKEHPSLTYCEDRVIEHYKQLKGVSRGQAIVKYLTLVESLPTYGVHYYEVKDKQGIPWWLGISYKGIGQYDLQDKLKPRKLYQWKQLENLYFREKKFAVEVNDPHRRAVTKRTFGQTGLVIHTWYASHSLIKTIWVMAISQHQFYLDRKQSKVRCKVPCYIIYFYVNNVTTTGSADSAVDEEQKKEKISELKKKEQEIQDVLSQKTKELKKICLREAELTGKLPKEYPLSAGERPPQVRRRVGTAFKLDDLFPYNEDPYLRNLESRFALQRKIVEAAKKLASEAEICKTVKRKRRRNCQDAMRKLQQVEDEMNQYRIKKGKKPTQRASVIIADELLRSETSSLSDSQILDDGEWDKFQLYSSYMTFVATAPLPIPSDHEFCLFVQMTLMVSDGNSQSFRHRSGSLESQQQILKDTDSEKPVFTLSPARRSNSTEALEDCSSFTSQSSLDYPGNPHYCTLDSRTRNHQLHRRVEVYGNTGSMPNLVQNHIGCSYLYEPPAHYAPTAYYVAGYPCPDMEPYSNGAYVYENEMEGHYNVNPSYHVHNYHRHERYRTYSSDRADSLAQNPYATMRLPRTRQGPRNEPLQKNMQKALVAEHLRGWYHRSGGHREAGRGMAGYDYDNGSQLSLGYQTMPAPFSHSSRTTSYSSGRNRSCFSSYCNRSPQNNIFCLFTLSNTEGHVFF
uniref:FERM domain containing 4B n=1 Tax=Hucho hucho TaxID=62062 RepID=A0A4W5PP72_9TELE